MNEEKSSEERCLLRASVQTRLTRVTHGSSGDQEISRKTHARLRPEVRMRTTTRTAGAGAIHAC